jgi:hypothetical protein
MSEPLIPDPVAQPHRSPAIIGQIDLRQLYCAALIVTLGSVAAFCGVFFARRGLVGTIPQVFGIFVLAILPVWSSVFALTRVGAGQLMAAIALTASIIFANLFPVLGFYAGYSTIWLVCAAIFLVAVTGWRNIFSALRRTTLATIFCAMLLAILLVVFTSPQRLFLPESLILGATETDLYYHDAIAQMIAHYGAISIGADGLVYNPYHFLSHVIAAGIAKSSGADVPLVYLYWGAFTLKIQLVWSALVAGMFFFRIEGATGRVVLMRFCYACLAMICVGGFESESFMCGMALLFAALPLLMTLGGTEEAGAPVTALAIGLSFLASILCALAKISAGFFCAIAMFVVLWRFRRRPAITACISGFLFVLAFVVLVWLREKGLVGFYRFFIDYSHYFTSPLTFKNYCLAFFVLILFLTHWRMEFNSSVRRLSVTIAPAAIFTAGSVRALKSGKARLMDKLIWLSQLDSIPQFLALSIAGCLFVLVTMPIGSNNSYFSWILYSVSFLFLPLAFLQSFAVRLRQATVAVALVLLLSFNLFFTAMDFVFINDGSLTNTITNMYVGTAETAAARKSGRMHIKDSLLASLKNTGKPFSELQQRIEDAPIARLNRVLQAQSQTVGGRLAVHIPPQASAVWHALEPHSTWWCFAGHLVVPAVTGFMEIRSIEPRSVEEECSPVAYYGFGAAQDAHRSVQFSDDALCKLARPLKIEKIYRLQSYRDLSENSVLTCR